MALSAEAKKFNADLVNAVSVGGVYLAGEYLIEKKQVGKEAIIDAGIMGSASMVSNTFVKQVIDKIPSSNKFTTDSEEAFLVPILTAGGYILAQMLLKYDRRPWVTQAIWAIGSEVVGSRVGSPIYKMIYQ